jgi:hypothetical protein
VYQELTVHCGRLNRANYHLLLLSNSFRVAGKGTWAELTNLRVGGSGLEAAHMPGQDRKCVQAPFPYRGCQKACMSGGGREWTDRWQSWPLVDHLCLVLTSSHCIHISASLYMETL